MFSVGSPTNQERGPLVSAVGEKPPATPGLSCCGVYNRAGNIEGAICLRQSCRPLKKSRLLS